MAPGRFLRFDSLSLWVVMVVLAGALAVAVAYDWHLASGAALWLGAAGLLFFIVRRAAASPASLRTIAGSAVLFASLVCLYFLTQLPWLPGLPKLGWVEGYKNWLAGWMPQFTFWALLPNSLATLLEGLVFFPLAVVWSVKNRFWRVLSGVAGLLILAALLLSGSRGAWLAVILAGLIGAGFLLPGRRLITALLGSGWIVYPALILVLPSLWSIPQSAELPGLLQRLFDRPDRIEVFRNSLALARTFPYSGVGGGEAFTLVYSRFELLIPHMFLRYPHQLLLGLWLGYGLAGYIAWTGLLVSTGLRLLRLRSVTWAPIPLAALLGNTAMLIHGLSDASMLIDGWIWLVFFFNLAVLAGSRPADAPPPARFETLGAVAGALGLGLVLLLSAGNPFLNWENNLSGLRHARALLGQSGGATGAPKMPPEVEKGYQTVVHGDPTNPTANLRLAMITFNRHNFAAAVDYADTAYRVDPTHFATRKQYGLALAGVGQTDAAFGLLQNAHDIQNQVQGLAGYYESLGLNQPAANMYRLLLKWGENPQLEERIRTLEEQAR